MRAVLFFLTFFLTIDLGFASFGKTSCESSLTNAIVVDLAFSTAEQRIQTAKDSYEAMLQLWFDAVVNNKTRVAEKKSHLIRGPFSKTKFIFYSVNNSVNFIDNLTYSFVEILKS